MCNHCWQTLHVSGGLCVSELVLLLLLWDITTLCVLLTWDLHKCFSHPFSSNRAITLNFMWSHSLFFFIALLQACVVFQLNLDGFHPILLKIPILTCGSVSRGHKLIMPRSCAVSCLIKTPLSKPTPSMMNTQTSAHFTQRCAQLFSRVWSRERNTID